MGCEWKDVVDVVYDMEWDSVVVGERASACCLAYGPEDWEGDVPVYPGDGPYLAHGRCDVGCLAEYLEGMALQWLAQQVCP